MQTAKPIVKLAPGKKRLKKEAMICLVVVSLYILGQLISFFQTKYRLESPIIPKSLIWEINKQYVFKAILASATFGAGLMLYLFKRYLFVIVWVIVALTVVLYVHL